ncbi:STAS domain-containing protein [Emcibacter sp.]|uniref:STAS domain-containing protein n=1 Tax=Emcibacter sp. TaxID=1979954 RepID=UPI002AA83286|nr:STAS domain-containing protein [Emcibacter sp.]
MRYRVEAANNSFEAILSEKITFSDLEGFREIIKKMQDASASENVVDLSDVEFIDSAGLGMLLLAKDEVGKLSSKLVLKQPQGQVKRMFDVAQFDKMFEIV